MGIVIGISGKKGSGKDTAAKFMNYIYTKGGNCEYSDWLEDKDKHDYNVWLPITHFADTLKNVLFVIFGIKFDELGNKAKDNMYYIISDALQGTPSTGWLQSKTWCDANNYVEIPINELEKRTLKDFVDNCDSFIGGYCIKLRTLLQYIGTNVLRNNISDNVWFIKFHQYVRHNLKYCGICFVPDVRFQNEATMLKLKYDAVLINIRGRNDKPAEHVSELDMEGNADFIIDNTNMTLEDLFNECKRLILKIKNERQ